MAPASVSPRNGLPPYHLWPSDAEALLPTGGAEDKAQYIWTTLHDFGGTDGLKGDLARINHIPFDGIEAKTNIWGTGFTPEGIDQNPVYYEFMLERNFATEPVADITQHIVDRSHRRYNLETELPAVTEAWSLLVNSSYAQDLSVQDGTGVPHLGGAESWAFEGDKHTPSSIMCQVYTAWTKLIEASATIKVAEPFRYDLVNTGREVLAQLAGPAGQNFTAAIGGEGPLDAAAVRKTGEFYAQVLNDIDALVATDTAFQIGPWIEKAKAFANMNGTAGVEDCTEGVGAEEWPTITSCVKFYECVTRTLSSGCPLPADVCSVRCQVELAHSADNVEPDAQGRCHPRRPDRLRLQALVRADPRLLRRARDPGDAAGAERRRRRQAPRQRRGDHHQGGARVQLDDGNQPVPDRGCRRLCRGLQGDAREVRVLL